MSDTSIRTAPDPRLVGEPMGLPKSKPQPRIVPWPVRVLKPLASLRLTVFLFVVSIILVFMGTLAQKDFGNWTVVNRYFRSVYVFVPFQVFVRFGQVFFGIPENFELPGGFPYPGGLTVSIFLLINLLAAHLIRFKISWKRSGIFLIHGGLILMVIGEWIAYSAIEGNLRIPEGQSSNFLSHTRFCEMAVSTPSDDGKMDNVIVIPQSLLQHHAGPISDPRLPFDIEVNKFMNNSILVDRKQDMRSGIQADHGYGLQKAVEERPEGTGVDVNAKEDFPAVYVTFRDKQNQQPLGCYLLSTHFPEIERMEPQELTIGGKIYSIDLRYKRTYKPYKMHLFKVTTTYYPGTETPKDFNSVLQLEDPKADEDRTVRISMNNPLRYNGEAFYQLNANQELVDGKVTNVTVLQVVRNPGWTLPYLSCIIVGLGMTVHFLLTLNTYLKNRRVPSHA